MHQRIIAERNERARTRLRVSVGALIDRLGLKTPDDMSGAERRDPAIAQMRELEILADVLDQIVIATLPEEREKRKEEREKRREEKG